MNVRADLTRGSYTKAPQGTGNLLQHPGEIPPPKGLLSCGQRIRSEHLFGCSGESAYAAWMVDRGRHAFGNRNTHLDPEGPDDLCGQLRDELLGDLPPLGVERPQRANNLPGSGYGIRHRTGVDGSPHQRPAAARIDPPRQEQLGHGPQRAERANDVLGQVWSRSMPAGAAQDNV